MEKVGVDFLFSQLQIFSQGTLSKEQSELLDVLIDNAKRRLNQKLDNLNGEDTNGTKKTTSNE